MIRAILIFILLAVIYQAVKVLVRSALGVPPQGSGGGRGGSSSLPGSEMVQDPNCRTYVVKDRAVARRVDGGTAYFCSEACADAFSRRPRE